MKLPQPGHPWLEQAALFAGIVTPPTGTPWVLLLPTDLPVLPNQGWGLHGNTIKPASSVFDGHANTRAMAQRGNKLAQDVIDLPGQCYLPSPLEALMLFATLRDQVGAGAIWTSRQCSAGHAWCQDFRNGDQSISDKGTWLRPVPVRRLILCSSDLAIANEAAMQEGGSA